MSVNSELSALLTKMGGTPLESDSNSDLIKKISNAYEGGGSGGGMMIVHGTITYQTEPPEGHTGAWSPIYSGALDKTAGEIYTMAHTMPVLAILSFTDPDGVSIVPLASSYNSDGAYWFDFASSGVPFLGFSAANEDDYPAVVNA